MGRIIDGFKVFLDVELFILVIFLEVGECTDPSLLDELVVAGELPGYKFLGVSGSEVEILVEEGPSDIFSFEHVLGLELDGEVG